MLLFYQSKDLPETMSYSPGDLGVDGKESLEICFDPDSMSLSPMALEQSAAL